MARGKKDNSCVEIGRQGISEERHLSPTERSAPRVEEFAR